MANKYTRKSKTSTPQQDEFVSFWERIYELVRPYARVIAIGGGAIVVVLGVVWGTERFFVTKAQDATEMLGRALRVYQADLLSDGADKDKNKDKNKDKDKDGDVPRFKTAKERAEAAIAEADKVQQSFGSQGAARRAELIRAGALFELGRYAEAEAAYRKFLEDAPRRDPMRLVASEGLGLTQEAQGKLAEALGFYQELEKNGGDFYRERALIDQARVLAAQGNKQKALDIYKQLLDKTPTTPLREEIQARQAQLQG